MPLWGNLFGYIKWYMKKVSVQLVKYDMNKTKNRKRKNMLVDNQSKEAVITQLERIHKGDKVVTIHEIIWDEEQIEEATLFAKKEQKKLLQGEVKFFDVEKEFGYIMPDNEDIEDLFFHKSTFTGKAPNSFDRVEFQLSQGSSGPCAIKVKIIESE